MYSSYSGGTLSGGGLSLGGLTVGNLSGCASSVGDLTEPQSNHDLDIEKSPPHDLRSSYATASYKKQVAQYYIPQQYKVTQGPCTDGSHPYKDILHQTKCRNNSRSFNMSPCKAEFFQSCTML